MSIEDAILEKVRALSPDQQAELLAVAAGRSTSCGLIHWLLMSNENESVSPISCPIKSSFLPGWVHMKARKARTLAN